MARCYAGGVGCSKDGARSLALARASAGEGSKYGQRALGHLYRMGEGGVAQDYAQAVAQFRLAAAQGYDEAQMNLGLMYDYGHGVALDHGEALRWYKLAAAQGLGWALYTMSPRVIRGATVLLQTGRRRFAGTSAPLQRVSLELQPI